MSLGDLEFKASEEWEKAANEVPWITHIHEHATAPNGTEYMRIRGRDTIYRISSEDSTGKMNFECDSCETEIQGATITHPVWDGPGPCSGGGGVKTETVPYCPSCEEKPNYNGTPIRI